MFVHCMERLCCFFTFIYLFIYLLIVPEFQLRLQVLYHLSHSLPSSFCFSYFLDGVLSVDTMMLLPMPPTHLGLQKCTVIPSLGVECC
jgi:hypothetical protein